MRNRGEENLFLERKMDGVISVEKLVEDGSKLGEDRQVKSRDLPVGKKNSEVCAVLCFSSGTTGLPKAVCLLSSRSPSQIHC